MAMKMPVVVIPRSPLGRLKCKICSKLYVPSWFYFQQRILLQIQKRDTEIEIKCPLPSARSVWRQRIPPRSSGHLPSSITAGQRTSQNAFQFQGQNTKSKIRVNTTRSGHWRLVQAQSDVTGLLNRANWRSFVYSKEGPCLRNPPLNCL